MLDRLQKRPRAMPVRETAERLSLHVRTVQRLLKSGELRGFRVGRVWRVSEDAITDFMNRGSVKEQDPESAREGGISPRTWG